MYRRPRDCLYRDRETDRQTDKRHFISSHQQQQQQQLYCSNVTVNCWTRFLPHCFDQWCWLDCRNIIRPVNNLPTEWWYVADDNDTTMHVMCMTSNSYHCHHLLYETWNPELWDTGRLSGGNCPLIQYSSANHLAPDGTLTDISQLMFINCETDFRYCWIAQNKHCLLSQMYKV